MNLKPNFDLQAQTAPTLNLKHLADMFYRGGIVQFADGSKPDLKSGHCVDDVARMAQVAAGLLSLQQHTELTQMWLDKSLTFLEQAYERNRFVAMRNMRDIKGKWLDDPHFGDHIGRTVFALGDIVASAAPAPLTQRALDLLLKLLPSVLQQPYLRPSALSAIGLARVPNATKNVIDTLDICAARLNTSFNMSVCPEWLWFEDELTYDNGRLPQALIAAGARLDNKEYLDNGLAALGWYATKCNINIGNIQPDQPVITIGNNWLSRNQINDPSKKYTGDEQPLDAAALVEALTEAANTTGDPHYAEAARHAFGWFLGNNKNQISMYDERTGGCHDGLLKSGVNKNMGAESTLAYYQALLALAGAELIVLRPQKITAATRSHTRKGTKK